MFSLSSKNTNRGTPCLRNFDKLIQFHLYVMFCFYFDIKGAVIFILVKHKTSVHCMLTTRSGYFFSFIREIELFLHLVLIGVLGLRTPNFTHAANTMCNNNLCYYVFDFAAFQCYFACLFLILDTFCCWKCLFLCTLLVMLFMPFGTAFHKLCIYSFIHPFIQFPYPLPF